MGIILGASCAVVAVIGLVATIDMTVSSVKNKYYDLLFFPALTLVATILVVMMAYAEFARQWGGG